MKIGSPLFILREECKKDLMGVLDRLAEIGYDGVEFLSLFGHSPVDIRKKMEALELTAVGDHVPYIEFSDNTDKVIADRKELGCPYVTLSAPPAEGFPGGVDYPKTLEAIKRIGEKVNKANMTLLYHNHAAEIRTLLDGKSLLEHIADDVDPGLLSLELDLGWIGIVGGDPEYFLKKYKNRCPVVHFKDYSHSDNEEGFLFRPTGYGDLKTASLYELIQGFSTKPLWYVLDHDDAYDNDTYDELKMSLEFFKNITI